MTTTFLSKLLGSATLFLTLAIRSTALAEKACQDGICIHITDTFKDGKAAKAVSFSGMPRAGDYVTQFYNVIIPSQFQREVYPGQNEQFVLFRTGTVSVQACRRLYGLTGPHTKCTGWVRFTVEVSPGAAAADAPTSNPTTEALKKLNALGGGPSAAKGTPKPVVPTTAPAPPKAPSDPAGSGNRTSSKDAGIKATPTMVYIPIDQSEGTTQIYWNAGPTHPYAEVWVKVGDEDPKRLLEKGKGNAAMKVRVGRNVFILTDAGEELATVTVTAVSLQ